MLEQASSEKGIMKRSSAAVLNKKKAMMRVRLPIKELYLIWE